MRQVTMVAEPPFADVLYVMRNLRDLDRLECSSTSFTDDPQEWAVRVAAAGPFSWAFYLNGTPVAVIGAVPRWPGVWNAYMLGTADFPQVALSVCKHARRFIIPAIFNSDGFQRMDAYAVADYCLAHRWLSWLGAQCEAPLANWGKNGETFLSFVWLREFAKSPERTAEASISEQS